jgi:HK97 family phage prohead protease
MTDQALTGAETGSERPTGPLRFRTATPIGVSFPKRLIEIIVTPWEQEALVDHPRRGRVTEVFSRGAYDGIERRANRVRVNRDHDLKRVVGRVLSFHPSRQEGLVGDLKIAQTELGDETLALADEGILDASAGYLPMPGGEKWESRNRVRIVKAWLGHIALTPDPAYDRATVLAVRNADPVSPQRAPTPNLDQVRAWLLEERYRALDTVRPNE